MIHACALLQTFYFTLLFMLFPLLYALSSRMLDTSWTIPIYRILHISYHDHDRLSDLPDPDIVSMIA